MKTLSCIRAVTDWGVRQISSWVYQNANFVGLSRRILYVLYTTWITRSLFLNYDPTIHPTRTLPHPRRNGPNRPHDPRPRQRTDLSGQTRRPEHHPRPLFPLATSRERQKQLPAGRSGGTGGDRHGGRRPCTLPKISP